MQSNNQTEAPKQPITLYNAVDRYQLIERQTSEIEKLIEDLKEVAHPGILDIYIQFSMIKTSVGGADEIFTPGGVQKLTPKNLRMLSNLEQMVYELHDIVKEARAELLPG